jgi:hypothetical protein
MLAIVTSLQYRSRLGLPTILHKIRGHTHILGKDLAYVATKRVITTFKDISEHQKVTVTIGKYADRPEFRVMYTDKPPTPPITLGYCFLEPISNNPYRTGTNWTRITPNDKKPLFPRTISTQKPLILDNRMLFLQISSRNP